MSLNRDLSPTPGLRLPPSPLRLGEGKGDKGGWGEVCRNGEPKWEVISRQTLGEMIYRSGQAHRGVVLLRLRDERAENKVRMMKIVLVQVGERLRNHYVVATETGIRVRE